MKDIESHSSSYEELIKAVESAIDTYRKLVAQRIGAIIDKSLTPIIPSEKIVRIYRILAPGMPGDESEKIQAFALWFGSWIYTPSLLLENKTPLEILSSDRGEDFEKILQWLGAMMDGVYL